MPVCVGGGAGGGGGMYIYIHTHTHTHTHTHVHARGIVLGRDYGFKSRSTEINSDLAGSIEKISSDFSHFYCGLFSNEMIY